MGVKCAVNNANNIILNDDILLIILKQYLNLTITEQLTLSTVSEQFSRVVDQSLRSVCVIDRKTLFGNKNVIHNTAISVSSMAAIVSKCVNAKHIELNNIVDNETDASDSYIVMDAIANSCHHIESFDFDWFDVNQHFPQIVKNCPKIKKLCSKMINDFSLDCIISSPSLESLDLRHNNTFTGLPFYRLGANITELSLFCHQEIVETAITGLTDDSAKRIKKLSIYVNSDQQFSMICSHFTELTHLDLHFSQSNPNFNDISLMTKLSHLSLAVRYSGMFTVNQLIRLLLAVNGANIRAFSLTHPMQIIDDSCVALICEQFPNLTELCITNSSWLTDSCMSSIARLRSLSYLNLKGCKGIGYGVLQVIKSCPQLRRLNLKHCHRIYKEVLFAFIRSCNTNAGDDGFVLDVRKTGVNLRGYEILLPNMPPNLRLLFDKKY